MMTPEERQEQALEAYHRSMTSPLVPPEYRGRTWDHPTAEGVIQVPFPPLRNDPSEITDEFADFRAYGSMTRSHPELLCVRCHIHLTSRPGNTCGHCRKRDLVEAGIQPTLKEKRAPVTAAAAFVEPGATVRWRSVTWTVTRVTDKMLVLETEGAREDGTFGPIERRAKQTECSIVT